MHWLVLPFFEADIWYHLCYRISCTNTKILLIVLYSGDSPGWAEKPKSKTMGFLKWARYMLNVLTDTHQIVSKH